MSAAALAPACKQAIAFYLPVMPVPLSSCFDNARGRGRISSQRYVTFKHTVDMSVQSQLKKMGLNARPMFTKPVAVRFVIARPDRRRRDLDNLLKALNDTLTRNGVLEDDSQIIDLRVGWTLEPFAEPYPVYVQVAEVGP